MNDSISRPVVGGFQSEPSSSCLLPVSPSDRAIPFRTKVNTIIRVEKNKNYSTISNVCLRDDSLSLKAKGLFAYIMTLPDDWKIYQTELVKHFSDGITSVASAMAELEQAGYITKKQERGPRGHMTGWAYTVYEHPQSPKSGNPILDNPSSDNSPLLSTDRNQILTNTNTYIPDPSETKSNIVEVEKHNVAKFEECWKAFGRYGAKGKALAYWKKLSPEERNAVERAIPAYMAVVKGGRYQKQFEGWINPQNRLWEMNYGGRAAPSKWNGISLDDI